MSPIIRWFACVLWLVASGCGGGSSSSPPASSPPLSAPPSTPPPTIHTKAVDEAANTAPPPVAKPAAAPARSWDDSVPPEQQFEVVEDTSNFTIDTTTPESDLFLVSAESPEGAIVTVELPTPVDPPAKQTLPKGFTAVPGFGVTETGWPRRIRGAVDEKEMACVPAGIFTQGTNQGTADAAPAHSVSLDTFYMDVTEVTIGEFQKFKTAKSGEETGPSSTVPLQGNPQLPVVKVSWRDAQSYARWAGKELPTEAEWEMAGRGTESTEFPWGSDRVLWDRPRSLGQIDLVGSYPHDRSHFGIMDLAGNVREWCSDWYNVKAYAEAKGKDGAPPHNWPGPRKASNGERVIKGGADRWELWTRGSHSMNKPADDIGFRCVLRCPAKTP
jgi:sulfatase modifying factor 1